MKSTTFSYKFNLDFCFFCFLVFSFVFSRFLTREFCFFCFKSKKRTHIRCVLGVSQKVFSARYGHRKNTRRQGNRPDKRTKVCRGAIDAVRKNAFTAPLSGYVKAFFGAWVYRQSKTHTMCVSFLAFKLFKFFYFLFVDAYSSVTDNLNIVSLINSRSCVGSFIKPYGEFSR